MLVDDHQLVRAGLAALIDAADDLRVVGEAADGEQALELARSTRPAVVLMDLSMPYWTACRPPTGCSRSSPIPGSSC
jgi:YesN/AraC family two-component response regulator